MDKQTPTQSPNKSLKSQIRLATQTCGEFECNENKSDNIQTPTQIATQSIKGCGKTNEIYIAFGKLYLCPACKSKILAYRTCWKNELDKWNEISPLITQVHKPMKDRISELTSALTILEGEQK